MAQFQVNCVESIVEDDQSQYSRFVIEPLGRSQGTTVGNA
ncbi:MAG: DNA-directed RNA polymerase subunit alpha, partial [Cyanobacteria bacterium J06576_12]